MTLEARIAQKFEKVFVDIASLDSAVARRVLPHFEPAQISVTVGNPWADKEGQLSKTDFENSKKNLWLRPYPGQFFKRCPGATQKKVLTCCNYHILNLGSQCDFNCSYCYLQSYLKSPLQQIYTNLDQALTELAQMADASPEHPFRVGTGEIIDSLSLDPLTLYSLELIQFFRRYPKWTLEFKTKSDHVDQFINEEHAGNVVVSWSINPEVIIDCEEHGTARLAQRLAAARRARDRGFPVAFHIDPIIWTPEWRENYLGLIDRITTEFKPEDLHVISLGTLRFQPEQRHLMRERFGMKSLVVSAEMFPSEGGKMRYDAKLRQEMFQTVIGAFKAKDPKYRIFLCMETPETWLSAMDDLPMKRPELKELFRPLPKIPDAQSLQD
jgi:spore photoproduct lyase